MSALITRFLTFSSVAVSMMLVIVLGVLVFRLVTTVAMATPLTSMVATAEKSNANAGTSTNAATTLTATSQTSGKTTSAKPPIDASDAKRAAEPPKEDNTKDAVANAMTAIGTAVAVIALLLAVGTSWFAAKQKTLDELIDRQRLIFDEQQLRLDLVAALVTAKLAVQSWVVNESGSQTSIYRALEINSALELLMADDASVRQHGFGLLVNYPWTGLEPELESLKDYTEACQLFHGRSDQRNIMSRPNLWCRIFWPQEQHRFDVATQPT